MKAKIEWIEKLGNHQITLEAETDEEREMFDIMQHDYEESNGQCEVDFEPSFDEEKPNTCNIFI